MASKPKEWSAPITNPALQNIFDRRSIRDFKPDPVPDDAITAILEAARWAQSAENYQPWKFIVIKNRDMIKKLGRIGARTSSMIFLQEASTGRLEERFKTLPPERREAMMDKMMSGWLSGFAATSPLLIICLADTTPETGASTIAARDLAIAEQNIHLACQSLGLGACWIGAIGEASTIRSIKLIKNELKIPDDYIMSSTFAIGYPSSMPRPRPRKPLEDIVFAEKFGQPCDYLNTIF